MERYENRHWDHAYGLVASLFGVLLVGGINDSATGLMVATGAVFFGYIGWIIGGMKDEKEANAVFLRNLERQRKEEADGS